MSDDKPGPGVEAWLEAIRNDLEGATVEGILDQVEKLDARRQQQIANQKAALDRLLAENQNLERLLAGEESVRRTNSRQSRDLMDFIKDDPAFPDADIELLFGDRAILVVARLRRDIELLRGVAERHTRPIEGVELTAVRRLAEATARRDRGRRAAMEKLLRDSVTPENGAES